MSKGDKIAIYIFGILLIIGIFFIGYELAQINTTLREQLYNIYTEIFKLPK